MRQNFILQVILSILIVTMPVSAETTIYRFTKIIDGTGEALLARDIAVESGIIKAVGNNLDRSSNGNLVDMGSLIALPGLIDAHTHITYGLPEAPKGNAWGELGATTREQRVAAAKRNALLTLETGVTSVRDLNAGGGIDFELRDAINAGAVRGPRIFTSGPGIHPANDPSPEGTDKTTPEFLKAAAEKRIESGADWIKIFGTTGSADDLTSRAYYSAAAIKAAADVAKAAGKRITVHSYGIEAVDAAITAGVTSLDHPVGLTENHIKAMKAADIIYVPTIDHNRYYAQHSEEYGYDSNVRANLRVFVGRNIETVRRANHAGVTIAMGSDAVLTGFGENTCELRAFIAAGMSNAEAIKSATLNGAMLLGQDNDLGRIKVGYTADFIAVSGDPLTDINAIISGVTAVMKEGVLVVDHRTGGKVNKPNCGTLY
ncbi:amidohydrolase family protein [Kordiimonas aquimaris]|uniref:amidohydrolase family protein n=1 Tax=Kordiimonas aquimaris TaxID=707591 RepID=UPI0021D05A79|nr:amidohydrolase family protein [Kordiimonas aquimaris]